MRGKNILTKRFFYSYSELDSVAEFLEKKAAEGWELTSKTGVIFGFRKCEPKKVKISVELVKAIEGDGQREMFNEMCRAAGWENIFSDGKLQIYQTEDMDAPPIHTDPKIKLTIIHKKCRTEQIVLFFLGLLTIYFSIKALKNDDIYSILTTAHYSTMIVFPLIDVLCMLSVINYYLWYTKAKKAVDEGEKPKYKVSMINKICSYFNLALTIIVLWGGMVLDRYYSGGTKEAILLAAFFIGVLLYMFVFSVFSAKSCKSREGNFSVYIFASIVVIIVLSFIMTIFSGDEKGERIKLSDGSYTTVYNEDIPLTMEELGITTREYEYRVSDRIGSPLAQRVSFDDFSDNAENSSLYYNIYTVRTQKLYDKVTKKLIEDFASIEAKAASFGANEAYYSDSDGEHNWILMYDEGIVKLTVNFELSEAQKEIAGRELRNFFMQS